MAKKANGRAVLIFSFLLCVALLAVVIVLATLLVQKKQHSDKSMQCSCCTLIYTKDESKFILFLFGFDYI